MAMGVGALMVSSFGSATKGFSSTSGTDPLEPPLVLFLTEALLFALESTVPFVVPVTTPAGVFCCARFAAARLVFRNAFWFATFSCSEAASEDLCTGGFAAGFPLVKEAVVLAGPAVRLVARDRVRAGVVGFKITRCCSCTSLASSLPPVPATPRRRRTWRGAASRFVAIFFTGLTLEYLFAWILPFCSDRDTTSDTTSTASLGSSTVFGPPAAASLARDSASPPGLMFSGSSSFSPSSAANDPSISFVSSVGPCAS
mmetsp:Transcript_21582/g.60741  ORF Transcript_21582/g.60741 Transcript_21582/m.60741 type:complete len:257 (+) Transcript_21582:103-873(+)